MNIIRVVIADDHPIVRDGLRFALEREGSGIEIVGEAEDGRRLLNIASELRADVYVVDITMPELNGLDAMREMLKHDRSAKIIILSLHDTRALVHEALDSGARGYLVKESATNDIGRAVREAHAGRIFLSPAISHYLIDGRSAARSGEPLHARNVHLTPREKQVLQLIAEGHTSKEIAAKLDVATNTVRVHRTNLMAKLGVRKETELVRFAIKEHIAKP